MAKSPLFDAFVNEYSRTLIRLKARQIIRRPGFCRTDQGDIEQELFLHLLSQARHFEPARGALNTFVARVIDSAVAMLVRERNRSKRVPPAGVVVQSMEVRIDQPDGPPVPFAATISMADLDRLRGSTPLSEMEVFELVEDVASVIASMPSDLQEVCESLLSRNRSETERELGLSRRKYAAAMERIRSHFSRAGFGTL